MVEETFTEESLGRRTSERQIDDVDEAHDEANYLRAIKEWEGLTYGEAYQKMQKIFGGLKENYGSFQAAFEKFDPEVVKEFVQPIKEVIESKEPPIQILVTGLGVSGKSTVAGTLAQELSRQFSPKKWEVLGVNRDYYDQRDLPPADVCVVENVNAFSGIPDALEARIEKLDTEAAEKSEREAIRKFLDEELGSFDLIIYTSPSPEDYTRYWEERVKAWREKGLLTKEGPRSEAEAKRALENREKWLTEDEKNLRKLEEEGKKVIRVDPDLILKEFFRVVK